MRRNGLEEIEEPRSAREGRPRWLLPAAAALGVALIAGGYAAWERSAPDAVSGEPPLRPLDHGELRGYLRNQNVTGDTAENILLADEAVESLGAGGVQGSSGALERAAGVVEALRARAGAAAFVRWSLDIPRDTPVHTAAETAAIVAEDGARAELYPLEIAALAVAALRSEGVEAMLAEVWAFEGDRSPPDPAGHFGYFVVAVYPAALGEGEPSFFDPYGGHATPPSAGSYRVLTDPQVSAAALGIDALLALVHENDATLAMERVGRALALDPRSPSLHGVRGAVVLASGALEQGLEELEAAAQLRPDAPRRNNLAGVYIAQQDLERASREVAAALEIHPDFAAARVWLAAIHLAEGETALARAELVEAERLDPDLMSIARIWAQYHMMRREPEQAIARIARALQEYPRDMQLRLLAAQIYRAAGDYDEMRRHARLAVELAPAGTRTALEEQILSILGPTALEAPDDDFYDGGAGALVELPELGSEGLSLSGGGSLSGQLEPPDPTVAGGLQLGGAGGAADPGMRMGGASSFSLSGPGSDLQLNLHE